MLSRRIFHSLVVAASVLAPSVLVVPGVAGADAQATEAERLVASGAPEHYELAAPAGGVRTGCVMLAVKAPLRVTRQVVTDYGHYAEFLPQFDKSRILKRTSAGTDVYLSVPILHGAASVWAVTHFTGPVPDGNGEKVEGRSESQGNVKDLRTVFRLYPADGEHTILKLELLVVPKLPIPAALLSHELRDAAERAVGAISKRAELLARGDNADRAP
jgi:ribosome-associated toxin RatA of RatAB toxin-antitoxin module